MSASIRRLRKEYEALTAPSNKNIIRNVCYEEANILIWTGYIVPEDPPYNKGAFRIEIKFPVEYPFKPPTLDFKTRIYHPNVDEQGRICLPIIDPMNWKPATKIENVIQALVAILHSPEVEHALRTDLAEEYTKDLKKFMKNAEDHTRKYAEKVPA